MKNDKTVGQHCVDLLNESEKMEVGDLSSGCTKDYMNEIQKCAVDGLDNGDYEGDFYVVAMRKRERHMVNVMRCYYLHRQTKPTPGWDMDLWRVSQKGDLFFCWSLPDIHTGNDMLDYPEEFKDTPDLLNFVHQFAQEKL
ncbi:MAG: hypothetical protein PVF17_00405 [Ignavibacteria bacterium]|jgi:hypothetical protein